MFKMKVKNAYQTAVAKFTKKNVFYYPPIIPGAYKWTNKNENVAYI